MLKMTCIGVGNVGRSWAVVFAKAGHPVTIWDKDPNAVQLALPLIYAALEDFKNAGLTIDVEQTFNLISTAETLELAVKDADYVQESVAESVEIKQTVFKELDSYAPSDCILASSSSAIPASKFLDQVKGSGRCLIAHPVNPPHVIPLVEICVSPWTDPDVARRAKEILQGVGQSPIMLNKEVDGFVLNRLQWALLGEAMHLVDQGYCSVEDIDQVLTQGLALRWAFIGPFEVGHLNASQGLKGYFETLSEAIQAVQNSLQTDYPATQTLIATAHDLLSTRIPITDIPHHQVQRDKRILKLRQHLTETSSSAENK